LGVYIGLEKVILNLKATINRCARKTISSKDRFTVETVMFVSVRVNKCTYRRYNVGT